MKKYFEFRCPHDKGSSHYVSQKGYDVGYDTNSIYCRNNCSYYPFKCDKFKSKLKEVEDG